MHKLTSKPITLDCVETDDFDPNLVYFEADYMDAENTAGMLSDLLIEQLEMLRQKYVDTKDKQVWKELVRWLPESWLQTRTVTLSYANLRNIYFQRKDHKLTEWHTFCDWIESLPWGKELITLPFEK